MMLIRLASIFAVVVAVVASPVLVNTERDGLVSNKVAREECEPDGDFQTSSL